MQKKLPFNPALLPPRNIRWSDLISLIAAANAKLARYDGQLEGIPNPKVFLAPFLTQEAVLSSRIEGTQATLEEVLAYEADPKETFERGDDIHEILNYRNALNIAKVELGPRPVSLNFLRNVHKILLQGVRGEKKNPGEFRRIQNWIGPSGSTIDQATFIPPSPEKLLNLLSNWEKYYHAGDKDAIVQLALLHAQFEIIHPFLDGNGRMGRIMVPIFLFDKGILKSPVFYISAFLESRRQEYYQKLMRISAHGDWHGWIVFFLTAVIEQATSNSKKAQEVMALYDEMKKKVADLTHSGFAIRALDVLFSKPVFSSTVFSYQSKIPKASAARMLKRLEEGGVIKIIKPGKGRRNTIYAFDRLLKIVKF